MITLTRRVTLLAQIRGRGAQDKWRMVDRRFQITRKVKDEKLHCILVCVVSHSILALNDKEQRLAGSKKQILRSHEHIIRECEPTLVYPTRSNKSWKLNFPVTTPAPAQPCPQKHQNTHARCNQSQAPRARRKGSSRRRLGACKVHRQKRNQFPGRKGNILSLTKSKTNMCIVK